MILLCSSCHYFALLRRINLDFNSSGTTAVRELDWHSWRCPSQCEMSYEIFVSYSNMTGAMTTAIGLLPTQKILLHIALSHAQPPSHCPVSRSYGWLNYPVCAACQEGPFSRVRSALGPHCFIRSRVVSMPSLTVAASLLCCHLCTDSCHQEEENLRHGWMQQKMSCASMLNILMPCSNRIWEEWYCFALCSAGNFEGDKRTDFNV